MLLNIAIIMLLAVGIPFGCLSAFNINPKALDPEGKRGDGTKRAAFIRIVGTAGFILISFAIVLAHLDLRPYGGMIFVPFLVLFVNLILRFTKLPRWYVISSIVLSNVFALLVIYFSYLEMVAASSGVNA